jgi:hypothetical protein
MRGNRWLVLGVLALFFVGAQARATEDWKGTPDKAEFSAGMLTGLGVLDGSAGFALLATGSKKLVPQGFANDITNSVSLETELGPLFVASSSCFMYGVHLRWDFKKDEEWTLYGLGGLAGFITGSSLGNKFELFPRFGAGAMWKASEVVGFRMELSHELIAVGANFPL